MKTAILTLLIIVITVIQRPLNAQILELNTLDADVQSFNTSTAGSNFSISSLTDVHTFILPDAGTGARGVVTTTGQTFGGNKTFNDILFLSSGTIPAPHLQFVSATNPVGWSYSETGSNPRVYMSFYSAGAAASVGRFMFRGPGDFNLNNTEDGTFITGNALDINILHDADNADDPQDGGVSVSTYGGAEDKTCTFGGRTAFGAIGNADPDTHYNQALAQFIGKGYANGDWEHTNRGVFSVWAAENHDATSQGAYCSIHTTRLGSANDHFSMVIDAAGNAGLTYKNTGGFNTTLPSGWATSDDSRFFSVESRTTTDDAGVLIQNGTTTTGGGVEGLNLWMDNSANITYFDNLQNTDGAYSLFRLKTVGAPLNVLSMAYSTTIGTCMGTGGNISASPASKIHIDAGNATASDVRWTAGTTTGQTSTDGFTVGLTNAAVAEIRQRENEDMWLYTNNSVRLSLLAAGYIVTGSTKENRYRTTDGGSNINSHFYIDPTSSTGTGSIAWGFDATNNFFCTQLNSAGTPKRVMGMAIKPVSLSSTAGDEAMAMTFYTQADGAVATEKMRITDEGNVGIGLTSPSAVLNIKAGTAAASTAPVKFTSGTNLTSAEAGATEYNNSFYQTKNSGLRYGVGGVIFENYENEENIGTDLSDLYTYVTPASTLAANGEKITAQYAGLFNTFTEEAIISVTFAGTNIFTSPTLINSPGGVTSFEIDVIIIRTGSSAARSIVTMMSPGRGTGLYVTETDLTGITFTTTNNLILQGQSPTGATADITAKLGSGYWFPAANN